MAIRKPPWLRSWFDRLNWNIFTWRIYVGDAVERALDWAEDWINWAIARAEAAWSRAGVALYKAIDLAKELGRTIDREIDKVLARISTWWYDLGDWWETKKRWVRDLLLASSDFLEGLIDDVERGFASLDAAWDSFRRDTLPGLLSTTWFTTWWGRKWTDFTDWEGWFWNKTTDRIETEVKPVRDEVNKHTTWFDMVKELFEEPEEWLLKMIERMLARFI